MDPLEQWLRSLGMRLTLAEEKRKERRKSDSQNHKSDSLDKEKRKSESRDKEKRKSDSRKSDSKDNESPAIPLLDKNS